MSNNDKMPPPRTIWMRFTENDGSMHVSEHQCWDKDRFIASRKDQAARDRARPDAGPGLAQAEQITEDEYRSAR